MAGECAAGARAWRHIEQARKERTLRSAFHNWLYGCSIQGSTPSDTKDEEVVQEFISEYLGAIREYHRQQIKQLLAAPGANLGVLEEKFEKSGRIAEEFLFALDLPEDRRPRFRRLRAALLYIESNEQSPAMAWAHFLIEALLDLDELVVLWRTRHARMAERVIGRRVGTGGSSVTYLDDTLSSRAVGSQRRQEAPSKF